MIFENIADRLIPGYTSLSPDKKIDFKNSVPGKQFYDILNRMGELSGRKESYLGFWLKTANGKEPDFCTRLAQEKEALMLSIGHTDEYKSIIIHSTRSLLQRIIENFSLLSKEQQETLARDEISHQLLTQWTSLELAEKEWEKKKSGFWGRIDGSNFYADQSLLELRQQKESAIAHWQESPQTALLRVVIENQRQADQEREKAQKRVALEARLNQLGHFFPILHYRKSVQEFSFINQIETRYFQNEQLIAEPEQEQVEMAVLTDLFEHCMGQMSQMEIALPNLRDFNQDKARKMATSVLAAFNNHSDLNWNLWFSEYENQWIDYMQSQLSWIAQGRQAENNGLRQQILHSLSSLFNNQSANQVNNFFRKMADAHGFIQAVGFSTQNENSFLAILDMYNYGVHYEQISETRSFLVNLLKPLLPLYNEYKDIGLYENNPYWKLFRIIMPLLIIVAPIVFVAAFLAPWSLPELAFLAAFIPVFVTSCALATKYVTVKNDVYKTIREAYYGGAFEIPEFQVNERMILALGKEKAEQVRSFYISELMHCNTLETTYSLQYEQLILSQEEIEHRKKNKETRNQLYLEWYDIHSNPELGVDELSFIVSKRLLPLIDQESQELQKIMKESITQVSKDIKETILKYNVQLPVLEEEQRALATTIVPGYQNHGLFGWSKYSQAKQEVKLLVDFQVQMS